MEPEHGVAREFVGPLSLALGLLFLAGIGVVVFVLLSGRRSKSSTNDMAPPVDAEIRRKGRALIALSERVFGKWPDAELSAEERVFEDIWGLEGQVNNGGFDQYFDSNDGDHASTVVASLQAIGADAAADIVRRAVTVAFGDLPPPADRAERQELVRRFSGAVRDALAELDQEFFAYPDDLTTLLHAYVVARRDRIRGASGF